MSVLHRLSSKDLTRLETGNDLWHAYRQACAESMYFFGKAVWMTLPIERNLMSVRCHLPLCLVLEDPSIKRLLVEYPRRHMKSTLATVVRPVHKLIKKIVAGEDPCDRFAIYSSSITNSQRFWREIRWGFEGNELFQYLFPELIPPNFRDLKAWNETEGIIPRQYNPKEPTFDCLGGGKATSRHYDDITEDDLINEENFDSPTAVMKALEYHRQAENLLEDGKGTIIVVGNRWSMADLNHVIHMEEPETAVISASCWGPNLDGKYKSRNLPEPVIELLRQLPDREPIWPERFTKEDFSTLLQKQKARVFSAQYLNNPTDPDVLDFKLEWIKNFELFPNDQGKAMVRFEDDPVPIPLANFHIYVTWDPALDEKTSESRNAVVVTGMDHKGRIIVLRDYAKRQDPLDTIDVFIDICETYKGYLKSSGMEEVLFQKVLGKLLIARANERKVFLGLRKLKTPKSMNKDQRIRAWVGSLFQQGKVYVHPRCIAFLEEYIHFGVQGVTRDLIDAFAYATQLWTKPGIEGPMLYSEDIPIKPPELGHTGYGSALVI